MPSSIEVTPRILVVVPCGIRKIWDKEPNKGPVRAESAYTGPPFKVNSGFARKVGYKWVILSANYGFIDPEFLIPKSYNITFKDSQTKPISVKQLKTQVKEKKLDQYDIVIALGGPDYVLNVKGSFGGKVKVIAPTRGLRIGEAMGLIKKLTGMDRIEMLKSMGAL